MKQISLFWSILGLTTVFLACGGDDSNKPKSWCDGRTVAYLKSRQGSSSNSYECATIEGELVYRKSTLCRAGAFYLEDSTGSLFVCDPSVKEARPDSGVVVCPDDVLEQNPQKTDGFSVKIKAEGNYYPAKPLCGGTVCWCQNGLEVERIDKP